MNLYRIDSTDEGRFLIGTKSGRQYDLTIEGSQRTLRRDGETRNVLGFDVIEVGYQARFVLSPLSDNGADVTKRVTTRVTARVTSIVPQPVAETV